MKLSIVVTTWGVEPWVDECLKSVHRAAAGQDVEILEVCNGNGVAAARNEGLSKATGDYVWFVDGDDVIRDDSIRLIAAALGGSPDIVRFGLRRLAVSEKFEGMDPQDGTDGAEQYDLRKRRMRVKAYRKYARWLLASTAVYRRAFVAGMRFEDFVKGEDSLWGRRAFYAASSLVTIHEVLYGYRQRSTGADQTRDGRHYSDAKKVGWLMLKEGMRIPGIRFWVIFDWLRYRFRELPRWYKTTGSVC